MIRFACPGCNAVFTVDPSKAGKTGKCPKCQMQFVIPAPEGAPPSAEVPSAPPPLPPIPAPPPPVVSGNQPVEIAPCPGCQMRLTVEPGDLGKDVECPECRRVFTAERPGSAVAAPPPAPPKMSKFEEKGRRKDEDDDEEERPSKRRRRDDDDDEEDDRPKKRSRYNDDDDDEEDDRPRKKKKKSRRGVESKRITAGVLAILLGGLGIHKFYLGYTGPGIITIVLSCFGIGGIIALIEGIIYLTKSDDDFIETYQIGRKEWF